MTTSWGRQLVDAADHLGERRELRRGRGGPLSTTSPTRFEVWPHGGRRVTPAAVERGGSAGSASRASATRIVAAVLARVDAGDVDVDEPDTLSSKAVWLAVVKSE